MRKTRTAILLTIILLLSLATGWILFGSRLFGGSGREITDSEFTAVLESAGFMKEEEFNAAYYGGRFAADEDMYSQLCRDGVKGIMAPDTAAPAQPGIVRYTAYGLSEFYVEGGSLFFPYGDHIAFIVFQDRAAANDFYKQAGEELLASFDSADSRIDTVEGENRRRLCIALESGISLLSMKGRTVLVFSGGGACALEALDRLGY